MPLTLVEKPLSDPPSLFAADNALKAQILHQPCNGASGHIEALSPHLMPDLSNTIDAEVFLKDTLNLGLQFLVTLGAIRKA